MPTVGDIQAFLEEFAPLDLAEEWDNVGLLIGSRQREVSRVMTCLTLTSNVADEAIIRQDDLIVTHHPVLFRPVQRLTDETAQGRTLLDLIAAGVAVYSPHTAFDSAADGINQSLAESLGLREIKPIRPTAAGSPDDETATILPDATTGGGRFGEMPAPTTLVEFHQQVKSALGVSHLHYVGRDEHPIRRVAVACGAAAEFLRDARQHHCDVLLTGEARFHDCLEAEATGMAMVLPGHYATERPAVERLAERIAAQFPDVACLASQQERDPVRWSVA